MEKENKPLTAQETFEIRQIALMQAIAENKAAKSTVLDNTIFRLGIAVIFLNLIGGVLALVLGCPCDTDKPWWHWLIFGIYVAVIVALFIVNLVEHIINRKSHQNADIDNKAKSGNQSLNKVLQMYIDDTDKINKKKRFAWIVQSLSIIISVIITIVAILSILFI